MYVNNCKKVVNKLTKSISESKINIPLKTYICILYLAKVLNTLCEAQISQFPPQIYLHL